MLALVASLEAAAVFVTKSRDGLKQPIHPSIPPPTSPIFAGDPS